MTSRCGGVDSDSSDGECESDDDEVSSCLEFGRETTVGQLGADGCELRSMRRRFPIGLVWFLILLLVLFLLAVLILGCCL